VAEQAQISQQFIGAMRILGLDKDERCQRLRACMAFYDGAQHDHAPFSWDGGPREPGVNYMLERMRAQGFVGANAAPAGQRKPDAPAPLARQVVSRFSEMLLGQGRQPSIRTPTSDATQEYLDACFVESGAWEALAEARDIAGACGSAALVIHLVAGKLMTEALNPADLWVAEWCDDTPGWSPRVVVEQYRSTKQVVDEEEGKLKSVDVWCTRAWTEKETTYYEDFPVKGEDVPDSGIPVRETVKHGLGCCPVVWLQNTRDNKHPDGKPDCDAVWPLLDKLDRLQSQVYKAAIANVDPTLVIKEEWHVRRRDNIIHKGSNHVIPVSPTGDARYLEMQGTSVRTGIEAINTLVSEILQTVECVVISPEYARAYQSGEALQILWRSMESRASRLRVTLSETIKEICYLFLLYAKVYGVVSSEDVDPLKPPKKVGIILPPRRVAKAQDERDADDEGDEEGGEDADDESDEVVWGAHEPGEPSTYVHLEWPSYWSATPVQIQSVVQAMTSATGMKPVVSGDTATRYVAQMIGVDPDAEVKALSRSRQDDTERMLSAGAVLGAIPGDPDAPIEGVAAGGSAQDAALNGSQIQSLVAIVQAVASKQLPRSSGIAIIERAFLMTPEQAARIIGDAGGGFTIDEPSEPAAPGPAGDALDSGEEGGEEDDRDDDEEDEDEEDEG
jgi:hypothetical protein